MWRWSNVANLDKFLGEVYAYYRGHGIWSIMLARGIKLCTGAFVIGFTVFLKACVDYKKIPRSKALSEVLVPQCTKRMSVGENILLWFAAFLWIWYLIQYTIDLKRLWHFHEFFHHLLEVPDKDLQTVSWQEIVAKLMRLRDINPRTAQNIPARNRKFIGSQSKQRMDAHDIANRLMRRENYLIALFNKDILDLTLPLPLLRHRQFFSRTVEWNISLCVLDFVFDEQGQVRPMFLRETYRRELVEALRNRFRTFAIFNIVCAPFIVAYSFIMFFFTYFTEYQRNPSQLGSRSYTPLAEWKFREFNELAHLFERRARMSYPFAQRYLDQFPKDKTNQLFEFIAFIAGALAAVLAVASILDPEMFLGFEITQDRTVLFYFGILGTIWAVARGAVQEETMVSDPEFVFREVIKFTHYNPAHWHGRLHTDEVRRDFFAVPDEDCHLHRGDAQCDLHALRAMVQPPKLRRASSRFLPRVYHPCRWPGPRMLVRGLRLPARREPGEGKTWAER